jgi:hypothetical protein
MPKTLYNPNQELTSVSDCEFYEGRTNYADETVGGYYAARISILEKLRSLKRQASALVLRFVTDEYTCPLGVWVCREAVKKSFTNMFIFDSEEEMINKGRELVNSKFGYDVTNLIGRSKLVDYIRTQKKLSDFI